MIRQAQPSLDDVVVLLVEVKESQGIGAAAVAGTGPRAVRWDPASPRGDAELTSADRAARRLDSQRSKPSSRRSMAVIDHG